VRGYGRAWADASGPCTDGTVQMERRFSLYVLYFSRSHTASGSGVGVCDSRNDCRPGMLHENIPCYYQEAARHQG